MIIQIKDCYLIVVQGNEIYKVISEIEIRNQDVEIYILKNNMIISIHHVEYNDIKFCGIKKIQHINEFEIIIRNSLANNIAPPFNQEIEQDIKAIQCWIEFKKSNELRQINQFYRLYNELYQIKQLEFNKLSLNQSEELYQSCIDFSQISQLTQQNDNIQEFQEQFIRGQMKWAQIDMENAELNLKINLLQNKIKQQQQLINQLSFENSINQKNLLESKQQLGDIVNLAIEQGSEQLIINLGI